MNHPSSQSLVTEEHHSALIVEYVESLEQKKITEKDLEHFTAMVFEKDLTRERIQNLMHLLGTVLENQPDDWLREEGEKLLAAAHAKREFTIHSLPDEETSTLIIGNQRSEFENSMVLEIQEPPEEEAIAIRSESDSDLELSGVFMDEDTAPAQTEAKVVTKNILEEEAPPLSIPEYIDPRLVTIQRIATTGEVLAIEVRALSPSSVSFGHFTKTQRTPFEHLTREEVTNEIFYLAATINYFFRKITDAVSDKMLEMNYRTIQKILLLEKQLLTLKTEWANIREVGTRRMEQFAHLEDLEETLTDMEEKNLEVFLPFMRSCFITSLKELFHEQHQFPEEIARIKKDLTELSEELYSLQISFSEKEEKEE